MVKIDKSKIDEILNRGVDEIIEKEKLERKLKSGRQLRVKLGIDPTSPDLHLGHTIPLRKLKQFQALGHKVILLIGDFTATIGDPSGRETQRKQLSIKEVKKNLKDYVKQAGKVINIKKTEVKYNSEWYKNKGAMFLMDLASRITYARATERDDFQKRMKEGSDINMLEILYPILQGYDSVELKADVEIGGSDQKFNLLMGRRVQKKYDLPEQDIMTLSLIEGTDGVHKMSKSYGNYIGIKEKPFGMYGKVMSVPDSLILKYVELLTDLNVEEVKKVSNPRDQKVVLAKEIVRMYHGEKEADNAEKEFNKVFRNKELPTDIKVFETSRETYPILDLLFDSGLAESKSDAKRVIQSGGVEIGSDTVTDWREEIKIENDTTIRFGKRKFIKIKIR